MSRHTALFYPVGANAKAFWVRNTNQSAVAGVTVHSAIARTQPPAHGLAMFYWPNRGVNAMGFL